nr:methyltransferase [Bosea lathyri]
MTDRVTAVGGDFFADPLPTADVITMGMILHDWNLEKKKVLIRKAYDALPPGRAYDALPPGGAFVVIEGTHRRCKTRECIRSDDVSQHAERIWRCLRLLGIGLCGLVS